MDVKKLCLKKQPRKDSLRRLDLEMQLEQSWVAKGVVYTGASHGGTHSPLPAPTAQKRLQACQELNPSCPRTAGWQLGCHSLQGQVAPALSVLSLTSRCPL